VDQKEQTLEPSVNDYEILVTRKGGKYDVKFVGFPMPQDVHEAQRAITNLYRVQRNKIAEGFNRSKQQHKQMLADAVVASRIIKAANAVELTTVKGN